ncbi:hypothetical protein BLNAU_9361 [Blattamonas nauphoetae]|uniref:Uncharacterized protein n=1 Tax=Blattamonas nauphoetae TaxID=2049346 RepID=A0ABQ9XW12_9EUKA|nr:hypothetical protein BLNAU_9361 [Blattamonas nauphoetae]
MHGTLSYVDVPDNAVDYLPLLTPTTISHAISFHRSCLGAPDTKLSLTRSKGKLNLSLGADVMNMLMRVIDCLMGMNDDNRSILDFAAHLVNLTPNQKKNQFHSESLHCYNTISAITRTTDHTSFHQNGQIGVCPIFGNDAQNQFNKSIPSVHVHSGVEKLDMFDYPFGVD